MNEKMMTLTFFKSYTGYIQKFDNLKIDDISSVKSYI